MGQKMMLLLGLVAGCGSAETGHVEDPVAVDEEPSTIEVAADEASDEGEAPSAQIDCSQGAPGNPRCIRGSSPECDRGWAPYDAWERACGAEAQPEADTSSAQVDCANAPPT